MEQERTNDINIQAFVEEYYQRYKKEPMEEKQEIRNHLICNMNVLKEDMEAALALAGQEFDLSLPVNYQNYCIFKEEISQKIQQLIDFQTLLLEQPNNDRLIAILLFTFHNSFTNYIAWFVQKYVAGEQLLSPTYNTNQKWVPSQFLNQQLEPYLRQFETQKVIYLS